MKIQSDGTAIESDEIVVIKKAKGVKKLIVENELCHKQYADTLFLGGTVTVMQATLQSNLQRITTTVQQKLALCQNDDKRYILPGQNVETLLWGHHSVPQSEDLVILARKHYAQMH